MGLAKNLAGYAMHRVPVHRRRASAIRDTSRLSPGLPPGLDSELFRGIAHSEGRLDVFQASYEHLSNWKPTGAYRVVARSKSGRRWTAVYKNADYGLDSVPAQQNLPAFIGRPEFSVLGSSGGALATFLPSVFWRERAGDNTFRYLMEDLHWSWYRPITRGDLLAAAAVLPELHAGLSERFVEGTEDLINYDRDYSVSLREYVHNSVVGFLERHPDPIATDLWKRWPDLVEVHSDAAPPPEMGNRLIHGDFNTANLYLHWRNRRLKAVDWEWAGVGYPHTDLASVLKHASPSVQDRALAAYAANNEEFSLSEHRSVYAWCRLQDAIRDAGYVAAQFLDFEHTPRVAPADYLARSLRRAEEAARMLDVRAWG